MTSMKNYLLAVTVIALASTALASCSNDDDKDMPMLTSSVISFHNVLEPKEFVESGTFAGMGNDEVKAPVILPGQNISFTFHAGKGQALMFATMYGASKDWFFAPENPGLKLFNEDGTAITGDVSSHIKLWDNGTKAGMTDDKEDADIMMVPGVDASKLMKLELSYTVSSSEFKLTITNMSGGSMNETPFSPGVWSVSNVFGGALLNAMPFYEAGKKTNAEITAIAQMGDNEPLNKKISANTGIITGISPAVVVVYTGDTNPIFELGKKDAGMGLKNLAQMGDGTVLKASLEKMPNVKKVYVAGNAPIVPGEKAEVQIEVNENEHIAYATMFGYSNDWFYANDAVIPADFKGDITARTALFDDGTAVSQYPGAGNAQGLFTGMLQAEDLSIMKVDDMFPVPAINKVLKVTIK